MPINSLRPNAYLWLRSIQIAALNTHIFIRLLKIKDKIPFYDRLEQINDGTNNQGAFKDTLNELSKTLKLNSCLSDAPIAPLVRRDAPVGAGVFREGMNHVSILKYFNSSAGEEIRKVGEVHVPHLMDKDRKCLICDSNTRYSCDKCSQIGCQVVLCITKSYGSNGATNLKTCFELFHSTRTVEKDTVNRKKKVSANHKSQLHNNNDARTKVVKDKKRKRDDDDDDDDEE